MLPLQLCHLCEQLLGAAVGGLQLQLQLLGPSGGVRQLLPEQVGAPLGRRGPLCQLRAVLLGGGRQLSLQQRRLPVPLREQRRQRRLQRRPAPQSPL